MTSAPVEAGRRPVRAQGARHRTLPRRAPRRLVAVAGFAAALTAVVVMALLFVGGWRWFVVLTASMGQAAPVGSLVVSAPVGVPHLRVGDIISFHPPTAPREIYTHRIVAISPAGVSTRGDINGAADPWTLRDSDIIGRAVVIAPGAGWALRSAPFFGIGGLALLLVVRGLVPRHQKRVAWISGFSVLFAIATLVLKPFVGVEVLTSTAAEGAVTARVVSTGILPITASIPGGSPVDLSAGMVGVLQAPLTGSDNRFAIATALHLAPLQWLLLVGLCAAPVLLCLVVPGRQERASTSHR